MRLSVEATRSALLVLSLFSTLASREAGRQAAAFASPSESGNVGFVEISQDDASLQSAELPVFSPEEAGGLDGADFPSLNARLPAFEGVEDSRPFDGAAGKASAGGGGAAALDGSVPLDFLNETQNRQQSFDLDALLRMSAEIQRGLLGEEAVVHEGDAEVAETGVSGRRRAGERRLPLRGVKTSLVGLSLSLLFLGLHLLAGQQGMVRRRWLGPSHVVTEIGRSDGDGDGQFLLGGWLLALAASSAVAASGLFELGASLRRRYKKNDASAATRADGAPVAALQLAPSRGRRQMLAGGVFWTAALVLLAASLVPQTPGLAKEGAKAAASAGTGLLALGLALFLHALKQRVDVLRQFLPGEGGSGGLLERLSRQGLDLKGATENGPVDVEVDLRTLQSLLEQLGVNDSL